MQEIIQAIKTSKIIAIVRGVESSRLIPLAEALYDGGIRLMEITYVQTAAFQMTNPPIISAPYKAFQRENVYRCRHGSHRRTN